MNWVLLLIQQQAMKWSVLLRDRYSGRAEVVETMKLDFWSFADYVMILKNYRINYPRCICSLKKWSNVSGSKTTYLGTFLFV
jgi:hypothetical protein